MKEKCEVQCCDEFAVTVVPVFVMMWIGERYVQVEHHPLNVPVCEKHKDAPLFVPPSLNWKAVIKV